ncbi:MAG: PH domain-containing protein [Candidatus Thermoplasmatota archaeon]|nr:PH domain-containing protein [Candidatus Thermoplasmatota archaeon]
MRQMTAKDREEFPMGAKEILLMSLRPHPLSFIRYYSVGIVLLVWIVLTYWLNDQGWLTWDSLSDDINSMMPAFFLALGAFIVGRWLVSGFSKGFRYLYWFAILVLLVVTGMFIWYWEDPDMAFRFAFIYGVVLGIMGIIFAEFYRRAFKYMITNQRIVIRYKLLSIEETNMRFEKIEDFEVIRSLPFRIAGLGTIRPYTGTEDAKADANLGFHGPHEAIYGVRKPNEVKRQLIEIILERDQWDKQMVDLLEDQKKQRAKPPAPAKAPPVAAAAAAAPVAAPTPAPIAEPAPTPPPAAEPAPASDVAYYQPAPEPPPEPEPAQTRNYEKIEPSQHAPPAEEAPESPPPPDEEEDPEPRPSPVRTMYPELKEPEAPLEMQDTRSMEFERGQRGPSDMDDQKTTSREEEEGWRKRDGKKPRSL